MFSLEKIVNKKDRLARTIRLLYKAYGAYRWQVVLIGVLGIFSSFIESIGVTTVVPIFTFVTGKEDVLLGGDSIFRIVNLIFNFFNIEYRFRYLLVFICFVFIFRFIFTLLVKYLSISIATKYEEETRKKLFGSTVSTNWGYLLKHKLGHLENALMIDVGESRVLFEKLGDILVVVGSLLVYIFLAFHISGRITMITLVFGTFTFLVLYPFVKRTQIVSRERVFFKKKIAHQVNQHMLGMKTIKSMDLTNHIWRIIGEYFTQHRKLQIKIFLLHQISVGLLEPVALIYIIGVFAYSYLQPDFNIGKFIVFIFLIYRIFSYVIKLQSAAHLVNEKIPHLGYALEYLRKAEMFKEKTEGDKPFPSFNKITFNDVNFSYPGRSGVLTNLNLTIAKGEMVGIVGPSGSGKTTMADLLLRLFKPTSGAIVIDAIDIQLVRLDAWRRAIGYLSQDIFLINDTVKNNISFYDESISEAEVIRAAQMAHIYDVVKELPQGFDTVIGERGIELSVGQRQRIAIARVLARRPEVLILDEATSALDNESEQAVQKIIEKFHKEVTIIMIAHRLTTVVNCDRILVIQDGKIVESGVPKELLQVPSSYFYKSYHLKD